jgi:hypothetical protein
LSLAIFCRCRYFCRQRYLVVIDILSPSIFCRRQYFVAIDIASYRQVRGVHGYCACAYWLLTVGMPS